MLPRNKKNRGKQLFAQRTGVTEASEEQQCAPQTISSRHVKDGDVWPSGRNSAGNVCWAEWERKDDDGDGDDGKNSNTDADDGGD